MRIRNDRTSAPSPEALDPTLRAGNCPKCLDTGFVILSSKVECPHGACKHRDHAAEGGKHWVVRTAATPCLECRRGVRIGTAWERERVLGASGKNQDGRLKPHEIAQIDEPGEYDLRAASDTLRRLDGNSERQRANPGDQLLLDALKGGTPPANLGD